MSHVTHVQEEAFRSRLTQAGDDHEGRCCHLSVSPVTLFVCDMTHSYHPHVTWFICDDHKDRCLHLRISRMSLMKFTRCDMTHSYHPHVTWFICDDHKDRCLHLGMSRMTLSICDMTHLYHPHVTWLICDDHREKLCHLWISLIVTTTLRPIVLSPHSLCLPIF